MIQICTKTYIMVKFSAALDRKLMLLLLITAKMVNVNFYLKPTMSITQFQLPHTFMHTSVNCTGLKTKFNTYLCSPLGKEINECTLLKYYDLQGDYYEVPQ